jgi:ADP-ribose pyrophosphatase YjhB (NUDIX family)
MDLQTDLHTDSIQRYIERLCKVKVDFNLFVNKGAGIIMTNSENKYLVALDNRSNMWSFPKGGMEDIDNSDYKSNAIRECEEETMLVNDVHYKILDVSPMNIGYRYYYAKYLDGVQMPTMQANDEVKKVQWMSIHELNTVPCSFDLNIWTGFKLGIDRYTPESIASFIKTKCNPSNIKSRKSYSTKKFKYYNNIAFTSRRKSEDNDDITKSLNKLTIGKSI